jgi:predicted aspartyl protease
VISRALENDIFVSEAYDPRTGLPQPARIEYKAIWDTGATGTVISPKVVQQLNIQPTGRERVCAVGSGNQVNEYLANTYLVNLYLPNRVAIVAARVSEGSIGGCDVLLGMDIISHGDFAITNHNGQTHWTFRVPSLGPIDFVEEINRTQRARLNPDELRRQRNREKALRKQQKHRK